jgi:anti-sigma regulatory factor (Ser/Thr protein kinase)
MGTVMADDLSLNLPSDSSAPGVARAAAARHLGGRISPERLNDLSLVISELVTNATVHGVGQVVFRLRLDHQTVCGEVIDQGAGFVHEIGARAPEDYGGRGLFVVDALTSRWGAHNGTAHIWFETEACSSPAPLRAG